VETRVYRERKILGEALAANGAPEDGA
jgi:hypothetical protein